MDWFFSVALIGLLLVLIRVNVRQREISLLFEQSLRDMDDAIRELGCYGHDYEDFPHCPECGEDKLEMPGDTVFCLDCGEIDQGSFEALRVIHLVDQRRASWGEQ